MTDYYSAWSSWLLIAAVCIAPATVAAGFGRGGFVIAAALCSAFALWSIFPIGFFTWTWPNQTASASFWYYLVVPFGLAVWAAAMAVSEKRRQRSDEATKQ
jgi:hypothetical protein